MSYKKSNPNGQATMANSEPVVIASDQSALPLVIDSYFKNEDAPSASGDKGLPVLAMRQLADTTSTDTDGDYTLLKIDEEGRLKVATKPASFSIVTSDITASAQTAFADVSRASNVMISMVAASLVGHNVTFEGSIDSTNGTDGNWFGIQVARSNANTIELTSGVLAATPAYAWEASVNGLSFIRVRATAHTSGTATWKFQRGSYATEPIPALQTHAVTASGNFAVTMAANATTTPAKAQDGAAGATDTGIPALLVRRDTPTALTPVAGDYAFPQISANGEQWVRLAGEIADDAAFTVATTRVVPTGFLADETATDSVDEGDAGIARMTLDRKQVIATYAHTAGGYTPNKLISAASTNATSIKASAGTLGYITASNTNAAARYLKIYNKASAPTVGTDVPVAVFLIPGGTAGAGTNIPLPPQGMALSAGIAIALTTGATDADTGAVAANEIIINYGTI